MKSTISRFAKRSLGFFIIIAVVLSVLGFSGLTAKANENEPAPQAAWYTVTVIDKFQRFIPSDLGLGVWWNERNPTYKTITYENGYNRGEKILLVDLQGHRDGAA